MGEYAEMMLDGTCCAGCGEWLGGSGNGFPEYCGSCQPHYEPPPRVSRRRPSQRGGQRAARTCPHCRRVLKSPQGMLQHVRDVHMKEGTMSLHHTTHIAGFKFRPKESRDHYESLPPFTELDLAPDPMNEHDPDAVKVMHDGHHVGFVPMRYGTKEPGFSRDVCKIIADGRLIKCVIREGKTIEIHYDPPGDDDEAINL